MSLARASTSSSVSNLLTTQTGPKISSQYCGAVSGRPVMIVGRTSHDPSSATPPVRILPPSTSTDSTYPRTFSKCLRLASAENFVDGSNGSPMVRASAAASNRSMNSS